ncbi:MAG: hypothetical protein HUU46_15490 [Candidatus Hydrogenedentes bacterium]|nr:hypothetical protein [Candidatus Hydrogenedentota bacterium]
MPFNESREPRAAPGGRLESLLLVATVHIPMSLLFLAILWKSMSWETLLDTPMFTYSGFLMDEYGMAPMRDFFTYNMPGTHVLFRWLYHFFGSGVLGMRLADTTLLAIVLGCFALVLRPFGWRVAWAGAVLFGIVHVTLGMHCYLQRDFIGLIPLQLAVLSATMWFGRRPRARWVATGFFVGALALVKPHLMIGGLVLYAYLVLRANDGGASAKRYWTWRAIAIAGWCWLGGLVPVLWMAAYLAYYGQLVEFIKVLIDYFPMHADISGDNTVFEPGGKIPYLLSHLFAAKAWDNVHFALGAGSGIALFLSSPTLAPELKKYGSLLAALGIAYLLYPAIGARFYDHHYYPFLLLSTVWAAFCMYRWSADTPLRVRAFSLGISIYVVAGMLYVNYNELLQPPSRSTGYYRTQRIAAWLQPRVQSGDTVQPIEWAYGGISHALLLTKSKLATHTLWGEVLFHHVSHPFVQELRQDFMDQLKSSRPRFVIRSKTAFDYVRGDDCTEKFPEFDAYLAENYFVALETKDFVIWESNASPTAEKDRLLRDESLETTSDDDAAPA